jgi:hypothetical protein
MRLPTTCPGADAEQSERRTSVPFARTSPVKVAVDRPVKIAVDRRRRIDHYIDYFGSGAARRVTPDPCGESLLDADGAR